MTEQLSSILPYFDSKHSAIDESMEAATTNGLQCPVCQRWGFSSQSITGHVTFCLEKTGQRTNDPPGFVNHQSNNQTNPTTTKSFKKQTSNNRGPLQGHGQKGIQKGKISWDRTVIDVDLTSDNEDNDDDFVDGHHPTKKKTTGANGSSSSSSSSSSSFVGTGKENPPYLEQPHIIGNLATCMDSNQNLRHQGRNVNGVGMMGAIPSSNTRQLQPVTHRQPTSHHATNSLQQNIERMALRAMVITHPLSLQPYPTPNPTQYYPFNIIRSTD